MAILKHDIHLWIQKAPGLNLIIYDLQGPFLDIFYKKQLTKLKKTISDVCYFSEKLICKPFFCIDLMPLGSLLNI